MNRAAFYQIMTGPRGYGWSLFSAKPIDAILELLPIPVVYEPGQSMVEAGLSLLSSETLTGSDDILVRDGDGLLTPMATSTLLTEVAKAYAAQVEQVARTERRFRALVQGSCDVIVVMDADFRVSYVSDAAERVTGHCPADRIGASALELMHPEDVDAARSVLGRLMKRPGSESDVSFRIRRADGQWRWMEGSARNLLLDPAVAGLVVNARDVTERRALQDQLHYQPSTTASPGSPIAR